VKRQAIEWEKIFVNHIFDEGLVSAIYIEFLQFSDKRKTFKKRAKLDVVVHAQNSSTWKAEAGR
jgi:hypothetical protein